MKSVVLLLVFLVTHITASYVHIKRDEAHDMFSEAGLKRIQKFVVHAALEYFLNEQVTFQLNEKPTQEEFDKCWKAKKLAPVKQLLPSRSFRVISLHCFRKFKKKLKEFKKNGISKEDLEEWRKKANVMEGRLFPLVPYLDWNKALKSAEYDASLPYIRYDPSFEVHIADLIPLNAHIRMVRLIVNEQFTADYARNFMNFISARLVQSVEVAIKGEAVNFWDGSFGLLSSPSIVSVNISSISNDNQMNSLVEFLKLNRFVSSFVLQSYDSISPAAKGKLISYFKKNGQSLKNIFVPGVAFSFGLLSTLKECKFVCFSGMLEEQNLELPIAKRQIELRKRGNGILSFKGCVEYKTIREDWFQSFIEKADSRSFLAFSSDIKLDVMHPLLPFYPENMELREIYSKKALEKIVELAMLEATLFFGGKSEELFYNISLQDFVLFFNDPNNMKFIKEYIPSSHIDTFFFDYLYRIFISGNHRVVKDYSASYPQSSINALLNKKVKILSLFAPLFTQDSQLEILFSGASFQRVLEFMPPKRIDCHFLVLRFPSSLTGISEKDMVYLKNVMNLISYRFLYFSFSDFNSSIPGLHLVQSYFSGRHQPHGLILKNVLLVESVTGILEFFSSFLSSLMFFEVSHVNTESEEIMGAILLFLQQKRAFYTENEGFASPLLKMTVHVKTNCPLSSFSFCDTVTDFYFSAKRTLFEEALAFSKCFVNAKRIAIRCDYESNYVDQKRNFDIVRTLQKRLADSLSPHRALLFNGIMEVTRK